jgi:DNA-binding NtrC family response regulator
MALILIVEDETGVADVIADALIELSHQPRLAVSADHALLIVRAERPDVILLDINLPDASGTSALNRLRQVAPDVPIIMVTGNADEELAREALQRGAFDYVMKPFEIERLTQVVEAALAS